MKKRMITILCGIIVTLSGLTNSFAAGESIFGENPLSSKDEFLKYFKDHPNISISDYEGENALYMDEVETGSYTVLSKQSISFEQYTYTVTVAGLGSATRSTCEIPIVFGSDEQNLNSHQIYILKRAANITIRHARKVSGQFTNTFETDLDYVMDDETFFTFTIQVSGLDANIYFNNVYVTTISEESGFKGYAGIRCTNPLIIKAISLQEGLVEIKEPTPTAAPEKTPSPEPSENPETTIAGTSKPTAETTPAKTAAGDKADKGVSPVLIGGIIIAAVIAACVAVAVIVAKKKK